MNYAEDHDFDKYKDILTIKHDQLRFFDPKLAGVIFIDGKNATKYHNKSMLDGAFCKNLVYAASMILNKYDVKDYYLYSYLDEITIVIPDICYLSRVMEEDNADCLLSLFSIMFYKHFSSYDDCLFKSCFYSINKHNISDLIAFRKLSASKTTLEYFFKEYCPDTYLQEHTADMIIKTLIKKGMYETYLENTEFREGIYVHYEKKDEC